MGVSVSCYIMICASVPSPLHNDELREKYEPFEEFKNPEAKGLFVLYDGTNDEYSYAGYVLARSVDLYEDMAMWFNSENAYDVELDLRELNYRKVSLKKEIQDKLGITVELSGITVRAVFHYR